MSVSLIKATRDEELKVISSCAEKIWNEYYISILSKEQIDYMIDKFQSVEHMKLQISKEGYEYYDWNVSAEDSVGKPTKESILKNIKKDFGKYNEPVILMHDSVVNKATVEALPEVIAMIKEAGYTFGTLDEREEVCHYSRK